jgi:hypothetical protein
MKRACWFLFTLAAASTIFTLPRPLAYAAAPAIVINEFVANPVGGCRVIIPHKRTSRFCMA